MEQNVKIRIGTRKSPLAMAQAKMVAQMLEDEHKDLRGAVELVPMLTTGDKVLDKHLLEVGGKGLFTKEIDDSLLRGEVDIVVNSLKDVATTLPDGIELVATPKREQANDVFISPFSKLLTKMPYEATIGTASLRRSSLTKALRPDLNIALLRGNVQTRLKKIEAEECHGTFLALAGLNRLGLSKSINHGVMKIDDWLPAPAQGAIGITARADDEVTKGYLTALNDAETMIATTAERSFLATLDGNCRTPICAYAQIEKNKIFLQGWLVKPDGSVILKKDGDSDIFDAYELGNRLGLAIRKFVPDMQDFLKLK